MLAATLTKYLIKLMANSCGSFKLRTLSNVLGGVMLGNSFKKNSFLYLPMYFSRHLGCFGNNL